MDQDGGAASGAAAAAAAPAGPDGGQGAALKGKSIAQLAEMLAQNLNSAHEGQKAMADDLVHALLGAAQQESELANLDNSVVDAFGRFNDAIQGAQLNEDVREALCELESRVVTRDNVEMTQRAQALVDEKEARAAAEARAADMQIRLAAAEQHAAHAQDQYQQREQDIEDTKRKGEALAGRAKKRLKLCADGLRDMKELGKLAQEASMSIRAANIRVRRLMRAAKAAQETQGKALGELQHDDDAEVGSDDDGADGGGGGGEDGDDDDGSAGAVADSDDDDGNNSNGVVADDDAASTSAFTDEGAPGGDGHEHGPNNAIDLHSGVAGIDWIGPAAESVKVVLAQKVVDAVDPKAVWSLIFEAFALMTDPYDPRSTNEAVVRRFVKSFTAFDEHSGKRKASVTKIFKTFVRRNLGMSDGQHPLYGPVSAKLEESRDGLKHALSRMRKKNGTALHDLWVHEADLPPTPAHTP
jgi:hypothetical protein